MTSSAPQRDPLGWTLCIFLFGFLLTVAFTNIARATDPKSGSTAIQASHLESYVRFDALRAAEQKLGRSGANPLPERYSLPQIEAAVKPEALATPANALLYAEILTEQGSPVPADVQKKIEESKNPAYKTLAKAYSQPKPSKEALQKIAKSVPQTTFLARLGTVQALEMAGDKNARQDKFGPGLDKLNVGVILGISGGIMLPLIVCAVLLTIYADARGKGQLQPLGPANEPRSLLQADRLAFKAAVLLMTFVCASLSSEIPWKQIVPGDGGLVLATVAPSLILLGLLFPMLANNFRDSALSLKSFGLERKQIKSGILWGIAGFFAGMPLVMGFGVVFLVVTARFFPSAPHPLSQAIENSGNPFILYAGLFVASVCAPIFEEILFRGTLFPALYGLLEGSKRRLPLAIATSSILFAALHPTGLPSWGLLGGIGALNCYLTYQTRSVLPGMVVHLLWNSLILILTALNFG